MHVVPHGFWRNRRNQPFLKSSQYEDTEKKIEMQMYYLEEDIFADELILDAIYKHPGLIDITRGGNNLTTEQQENLHMGFHSP